MPKLVTVTQLPGVITSTAWAMSPQQVTTYDNNIIISKITSTLNKEFISNTRVLLMYSDIKKLILLLVAQ